MALLIAHSPYSHPADESVPVVVAPFSRIPTTWWGLLAVAADRLDRYGPVTPAAAKAEDGHLCLSRLLRHILDPYARSGEYLDEQDRGQHTRAVMALLASLDGRDLCQWERQRSRSELVSMLRVAAGAPVRRVR